MAEIVIDTPPETEIEDMVLAQGRTSEFEVFFFTAFGMAPSEFEVLFCGAGIFHIRHARATRHAAYTQKGHVIVAELRQNGLLRRTCSIVTGHASGHAVTFWLRFLLKKVS